MSPPVSPNKFTLTCHFFVRFHLSQKKNLTKYYVESRGRCRVDAIGGSAWTVSTRLPLFSLDNIPVDPIATRQNPMTQANQPTKKHTKKSRRISTNEIAQRFETREEPTSRRKKLKNKTQILHLASTIPPPPCSLTSPPFCRSYLPLKQFCCFATARHPPFSVFPGSAEEVN